MLRVICVRRRQAVALFSFKSFRARQKIPITPTSVLSVFAEKLDPQDRLLRQSSVGAGASRFLVLDKHQRVRGVYHPLLCLPYPLEGAGVLGLPVETYTQRLQECLAGEGNNNNNNKEEEELNEEENIKEVTNIRAGESTLVVVSCSSGLAIAAYAANGSVRMPLMHVKLPAPRGRSVTSISDHNNSKINIIHSSERDMRPFTSTTTLAQDLAEVMAESSNANILKSCGTYFFLSGNNAAVSLDGLKTAWEAQSLAENSLLRLDDNRWVALPDTVARRDRSKSLYRRDEEGHEVVQAKGLHAGVRLGFLELDA